MSWIFDFYRSPMGKKAVMAVTGILLFGFVLGHMIGNLKLYMGSGALDHYAEGLRELGDPFLAPEQALWIARLGLLAILVVHIHAAVSLTLLNRRARPTRYKKTAPQASTVASRTMIFGGVFVLAFVVFHLMHLTIGNVHPTFEAGKVYRNVVLGLRDPLVAGFYILAQVGLGLHLYHGLWSLFQTLGWNGPRLNDFRKKFAVAFALLITLVNISFPAAVFFELVGRDVDTSQAADTAAPTDPIEESHGG